MSTGGLFLESVIKRFTEYKLLGEKTLAQLNGEELYYTPNESSNSIATIIQHLHGNMLSRWTNFLTEDGEKSWRNRDTEFEPGNWTKEEILQQWQEGWTVLLNTLQSLTEADLSKKITIRTEPIYVIDAINRQLAHYGAHVGQIIYIGKMIKDRAWRSPSIAKGASQQFNQDMEKKDWEAK